MAKKEWGSGIRGRGSGVEDKGEVLSAQLSGGKSKDKELIKERCKVQGLRRVFAAGRLHYSEHDKFIDVG